MGQGGGATDVVVVMGVSGTGKSTVAKGLSTLVGWTFAEGDAFHPEANIAKMRDGIPLTDDDRWPWLRELRDWMAASLAEGESAVVTCSALRRVYRDLLREAGPQVRFLHLEAPERVIGERMAARRGHYMPPSLLRSQYETLEPLEPDELAAGSCAVSVEGPAPEVLRRSVTALGLHLPDDAEFPTEGHRS